MWSRAGAAFTTIKRYRNQFNQTSVVDVSRRSHDEVAVGKLARMKTNGCLVIERRDRLPRAFDGSSKRMIGEICRIEQFAKKFVRRVLDHLHLFEDDFLFPFQVFLLKTRVRNQIGQYIDGLWQRVIRNLYCKTRHLMGRIGIEIAPQAVSFNSNIPRAPVPGALENRVLDEVANSV
jgi:hypothetical protein